MVENIILAVAIVGATGLIFGLLLAFASVIFKVETDEREEKILELLPGANCGACGYAGCAAYAAAIVNGGAGVNGCPVGKAPVAEKISQIMGVEVQEVVPMTAKVMCGGNCELSINKYIYVGEQNCKSAARLAGGAKACPNGCLGLGSCVSACKFDAIRIENGIAVINGEKCEACGMCVTECPKNIIKLIPKKNKYYVECANTEKGGLTNKYCAIGCLGCKKCEKVCPFGAIKVENNVAIIDYSLCKNCGLCAKECPKRIIKKRGE